MGSEMCIRDRTRTLRHLARPASLASTGSRQPLMQSALASNARRDKQTSIWTARLRAHCAASEIMQQSALLSAQAARAQGSLTTIATLQPRVATQTAACKYVQVALRTMTVTRQLLAHRVKQGPIQVAPQGCFQSRGVCRARRGLLMMTACRRHRAWTARLDSTLSQDSLLHALPVQRVRSLQQHVRKACLLAIHARQGSTVLVDPLGVSSAHPVALMRISTRLHHALSVRLGPTQAVARPYARSARLGRLIATRTLQHLARRVHRERTGRALLHRPS